MSGFDLSELQAQAILDMRLARLAALERKKIEDEYLLVIQLIAELEDILANPGRILSIIKDELTELKRKYAGERRTRVVDDASREMTDEDLIADEDVVITISGRGYIKRQPGRHGLALDVAAAADRDDDVLVGDEVLVGHLAARVVDDARAALAGVLALQLGQLVLDDAQDAAGVGQDVLELGDELDDQEVLVLDLLALERGQAGQTHVEDGLGLELGEVEARHQVGPGEVDVGRRPDRPDHLVQVVEGDLEALEDVGAGLGLAEVELRAPSDDLAAVVDVVLQDALQRQSLRLAV